MICTTYFHKRENNKINIHLLDHQIGLNEVIKTSKIRSTVFCCTPANLKARKRQKAILEVPLILVLVI